MRWIQTRGNPTLFSVAKTIIKNNLIVLNIVLAAREGKGDMTRLIANQMKQTSVHTDTQMITPRT